MRPVVFDGFHRCLPVLAESGNNLIVDHIVETEEWLSDLLDLLSAFDVFVVRVHCPLSELERRERDRGDRGPGEARADFKIVHSFIEYDLEVDSTQPSEAHRRSCNRCLEHPKPAKCLRSDGCTQVMYPTSYNTGIPAGRGFGAWPLASCIRDFVNCEEGN